LLSTLLVASSNTRHRDRQNLDSQPNKMHSFRRFIFLIGFCSSAAAEIVPRQVESSSITASASAPASSLDPNYASCQTAFSFIESCAAETTSFTDLNDGMQASCLCYSSSTWVPNVFDAYQTACVLWASTADPTDASVFQAAAGLCTRVGNVASATVEATTAPVVPNAPSTSASVLPTSSIPVATITLPAASATSSAPSTGGAAGPVVVGQVRYELSSLASAAERTC